MSSKWIQPEITELDFDQTLTVDPVGGEAPLVPPTPIEDDINNISAAC